MMLRIKAKLLSFYTKRLIRTHRVERANVGFEQARTVGILYHGDSPQKQEAVHQLATQLKELGKKVTTLCYVTDSNQVANLADTMITLRDIQLLGKIAPSQARAFVDTPFDYLYQVDLEGHPVIDYLLARSKAACRVGHYTADRAGLFELMVSLEKKPGHDEITNLTAQMLHYTQLLRTK